MNPVEKAVYITFDDGPHPQITPWVLDELKTHNALATFFCIGDNVQKHPDTYQRILDEGHAVGNHTFNHLNGWKTSLVEYTDNFKKAAALIDSHLFRPPYGRIKAKQASSIQNALPGTTSQIIMWDVLSGDFDKNFTAEECLANVVENVTKGSIIVFHDSEKAFGNLRNALPKALEVLSEKGYVFRKIE